jgi:histidyl-tRNA synthetase
VQSVFANERSSYLLAKLQEHLLRYGYVPKETGIIENADLFLTKAGDQIVDRMFTFQKSGRELAFRPEFTAAAAKQYANDSKLHGETLRWQFAGPIFTTDQTGSLPGLSVGAELIGAHTSFADAEVLAAAINGLDYIGLRDSQIIIGQANLIRTVLRYYELEERTQGFIINNRTILRDGGREPFLDKLKQYLPIQTDSEERQTANHNYISTTLNDLLKNQQNHIGGRSPEDIAERVERKQKQAAEYDKIVDAIITLEALFAFSAPATEAFHRLSELLPLSSEVSNTLEMWEDVTQNLQMYDVNPQHIIVQPDLALTWDYYTGIVFEIQVDGVTVTKGGRYDDLIALMGTGVSAPAVGFAYYVDRLSQISTYTQPLPDHLVYSMCLSSDQNDLQALFHWVNLLRSRDINLRLVFDASKPYDMKVIGDLLKFLPTGATYTIDAIDELNQDLRNYRGG